MIPEVIPESNSSVAVKCNIRCRRGEPFSRIFRYWLDSAKTQPRDIMSSVFIFQVLHPKTKTLVLEFTQGDDMNAGNVQDLTTVKTANEMILHPDSYNYFIKIDGVTRMYGLFIVEGLC